MRSKYLLFNFIVIMILALASACTQSPQTEVSTIPPSPSTSPGIFQPAPVHGYKIIQTYNHDKNAFTEGLDYADGTLYESTGLNGKSSLRQVDLPTGEIQRIYNLPEQYFGEGITVYKDKILQLTWKSQVGFVYNRNDFSIISQFSYTGEGWGLTFDGQRLILSDGTSNLLFLNPDTFAPEGQISVHDQNTPINNLNELEYINGQVYANVWQTNRIAIIDPIDGRVTGWLDLTGILQTPENNGPVDVLNGIAYNAQTQGLLVTGKYWPYLYEIVESQ